MSKKNYRLRDLLLSSEDMELLNKIADDLCLKNSDLARMLLKQKLMQIKSEGLNSFELAIVGKKGGKK